MFFTAKSLSGYGRKMIRSYFPLFCISLLPVLAHSSLIAGEGPLERNVIRRQSGNATTTVVPAPIVIAASQDWDGNDGPWSSFTIQVGNPAQIVKVFPSTSGYQTIVVLKQGCTANDATNCPDLRGRIFDPTASTSWVNNTANLTTQIYPNNIGRAVGLTSKGAFGFDDVTLDWPGAGGPTVKNQTVGGIATKDSFLGQFGLAPRASNFTSFSDPVPSYMENLKSENKIPSKAWAYTAGNQYRLGGTLGSLVLGGYDKSKFISHPATWSMNPQDIRDLTVQITDITTSISSGGRKLLDTPFSAFLDSSISQMWLPQSICELFEQAFNLRWNETVKLYLLSNEEHDTLVALNPEITFKIGTLDPNVFVNITLPYAAFDLQVGAPIVPTTTRYFPLKRTNKTTEYTLGRVFFQEAYVIADYERGNFSVSQRDWTPNVPANIVAIRPPSAESPTPTPSNTPGNGGPPIGGIVGGVIGGVVVIVIIGFGFCFLRRRKRKAEDAPKTPSIEASEEATATVASNARTEFKPELPGESYYEPYKGNPETDVELPDGSAPKAELPNGPGDPHIGAFTGAGAAMHEMEGGGRKWTVVEADGREVEIHEMPATEEVAVEMFTPPEEKMEVNYGKQGFPGRKPVPGRGNSGGPPS